MARISGLILCLALIISTISTANAEPLPILSQPAPDSPPGERNRAASPQLAQYAFVIGDWDVDITLFPPQGEPLNYAAKWHNIWIVDGMVVFQEWRGPYVTGAEIRSYDVKADHWISQNIYPGRAWYQSISTWNEDAGEMTVARKMNGPKGEHLNEEIYYDITANRFKIRTRKSFDEGVRWEKGGFELTATRTK